MNTAGFLRSLIMLALGVVAGGAFAASGQVQLLSGTLSSQRADGSVRILSQKSEVNPGDVLTTQRDSYVQIGFSDGSSMTMRPNSQMKIETYQFDEAKPQEDSALFRLIKGGLRTVTGLVGKRGNQDAYRIGTATATIGIRGSSGDTLDCSQGCDGVVSGGEKLQKGVYHTTHTGSYIMQTDAGSQIIGEGQAGFVDDAKKRPEFVVLDNLMKEILKGQIKVGSPIQVGGGSCTI